MIIKTPYLDEISISKWFKTKYSPDQETEIQNLLDNEVWITARRERIPAPEMTTKHIKNTIRCLNGEGKMRIPEGYLGGKDKWLSIFDKELIKRQ